MGNVQNPGIARVIVVKRRREIDCVAFHTRGSNKRGFFYRVHKSRLHNTLIHLRGKHNTYETLDIHCDKNIRELSFRLGTDIICGAGVRRVNLLSKGSSCVLSNDSTICGVRIWEWNNDYDNRGKCMCRLGHELNIKNFVRPHTYLPSPETSPPQPPAQPPRPIICTIEQPPLAPTPLPDVPGLDLVPVRVPNGRSASPALPSMQEAAGELDRGGGWGEVATTPQELNTVADGEQPDWSDEIQTGHHTVPPAVPDPPASGNPSPNPPTDSSYHVDLEIPPTWNMPGSFPDSDEWVDGGPTLAGGSIALHVGASVLSGSTIGDHDMHHRPRTEQSVDFLAHESRRRRRHRPSGHVTDSASDTIYDSNSDVDTCRSENANHETVDVVAGDVVPGLVSPSGVVPANGVPGAVAGGAVATGGVVDDPATVKSSLGLFSRLFAFA